MVLRECRSGIILEDDCLPDPSFFGYTKELLEKYKHDERVMIIGGLHTQNGEKRGDASYYFSRYPHIWGWASWRRAWAKYDVQAAQLPEFRRQKQIHNIFDNPAEQEFWMKNFESVYENKVDTWDYQWVFTIFANNGMCILPNVNLVSNIGFGADATHTHDPNALDANHPTEDIGKLSHPQFMLVNKEADTFESQHVFHISPATMVPAGDSTYRKLVKKIPQGLKDTVKKAVGKS